MKKKILYTSKPSYSAGFTFIEIIVLILVLGILSAVALTRANDDTSRIATSIALQQVAADIDYSKSLSFSTNDTITMTFDLEENVYSVYSGRNNARSIITNFPNFDDNKASFPKLGISKVNLKNTTFYSEFASSELQFLPGGIPYIGGSITVNNKTLTISNETGKWTID